MILEPDRTFKENIFCKQWFSEEMTFLKTSSYENNKICKYNFNLWQNKLDNNVMILSAKFADIKVSNFLIDTRLDACEYSYETIRILNFFRSQPHCSGGYVCYLAAFLCENVIYKFFERNAEVTWSVQWTGQLKKLIISFETEGTYKVSIFFVFKSNEESLSNIWFSSSNFVI